MQDMNAEPFPPIDLAGAASITALLREHVRLCPGRDAVALVTDPGEPDGVTWWSYAVLDEHARRIGAWLQDRGAPGDRVLLFYPNGPEFVAALVGCLYAGMVALPAPVPGAYQHEQRRAAAIARNSRAAFVLTDAASHEPVAAWAGGTLPDAAVLATDAEVPADPGACRIVDADRDTLAVLQYTSGSTSDPKGVQITHGNLLHNADSHRKAFGLGPDTRCGAWIPNYHDMGLMGLILPQLAMRLPTMLMSASSFLKRPHLWLQMVSELGLNFTAAPNFAYDLCVRRVSDEQIAKLDLSGWKHTINGSEPVRAEVLDAFRRRFAPAGLDPRTVVPAYGMAEATVFVSAAPHRQPKVRRVDPARLEAHHLTEAKRGAPARELVSCGHIPHLDIRIVDPGSRRVLPEGEVGEIWLRGESISPGYWEQPAATAETFHQRTADGEGGFLRTGDLGALHEGELYVTGRIKETLIIRGRNLYPQDIEHELRMQHRQLDGCVGAVFAVPHARTGNDVLVVAHEIRGRLVPEDLADLAQGMRQTVAREFGTRLGGVALLRRGGIRRTTSGKIKRTEMRDLFLQRQLTALHLDHDDLVPAP